MNWTRIGTWHANADSETFRIFPKGRDGKSRPVTLVRNFLYLRHPSGTMVVFKRYLHQKKWFWRDSRDTTHCPEHHVVAEVARMVFGGDRGKAMDLVSAAISGRDLS